MAGPSVFLSEEKSTSQEDSMKRKTLRNIVLRSAVLAVMVAAAWQAQAQDAKTPYPSMAPLDQYLMERSAEIALARSAAPESISRMPTSWSSDGMVTKPRSKARTVSCAWWSDPGFAGIDDPDFWNPKLRGPICLNAPAARSYLPLTYQENRVDIGWTIQSSDVRGHQSRRRQEGIAGDGIRRDVLHDVKARVLERPWWALASPPDVFHSNYGPCRLGR